MCSAACLGFSARLPHRHLWARAAVKPYRGGCPVSEIKRPCGLKRPRTLNNVFYWYSQESIYTIHTKHCH